MNGISQAVSPIRPYDIKNNTKIPHVAAFLKAKYKPATKQHHARHWANRKLNQP